jgi:hypothetical protein
MEELVATRSIAERRRATSAPLHVRLVGARFERQQAPRATLAWMLAWLYQAQVALDRWGARVAAAIRETRLAERALEWHALGCRWVALWGERGRKAWRARQATRTAHRQAAVTGRAELLAVDDPSWRASTAAARVEFHDAPAPIAVSAMPSTPLPEHLWRQWHEPAADRVPHAPPLRLAGMVALVAGIAVLALSVVTYAAVTHGWHGLPTLGKGTPPLRQVVIHAGATPSPSVDQPPYYVGAWVSDSAPPPTSVVTVYVRVTDSTSQAPMPAVVVTVYARFTCQTGGSARTFGPAKTGPDGVAAVQVGFAGLPVGQPVCLTASASVGGQTLSADTTFTAAFPAAPTAPPAQPTSPPAPGGGGGGDGGGGGGVGGGGGGFPGPTPTPPGHRKP